MKPLNSKAKGDLLEQIVGQICSTIKHAKVENNVKIKGTSGVNRQIDTLITGKMGMFDIRILVDSKNYAKPVDINEVESFSGMVSDVVANLGVMVCSSGFTEGARKRASSAGIELFEIYDSTLGNTSLLVPVGYIEAHISQYQFAFEHSSAAGHFSIPMDQSRWEFHIDGKKMLPAEVPYYVWNKGAIPQRQGDYNIMIGAVKMTDTHNVNSVQYCDIKLNVKVVEDYFLKLFPTSYLKKIGGDPHFNFRIDIYSKTEDMLKNGWVYFKTLEELQLAANTESKPQEFQGPLILRTEYSLQPPLA